jgi:diketogulonate reductase-like aldo/keto reductase
VPAGERRRQWERRTEGVAPVASHNVPRTLPGALLALQRSAGNAAANRLLRNGYKPDDPLFKNVKQVRAFWANWESGPEQPPPRQAPPRRPHGVTQWPPPQVATTETAVQVPAPVSDTRQAFGTDIPGKTREEQWPDEDKVKFLVNALQAGYRFFDTAEDYETPVELLERAARQAGVPLPEILIAYKLKPPKHKRTGKTADLPENERLSWVQEHVAHLPEGMQKILMLHELADRLEQTKAWLATFASTAGVVAVGVSNVQLDELKDLHAFASQNGAIQLKFAQNPCSPLFPDKAVREFCAAHSITYMGYGLFGSQGMGVCDEGFALPPRHLQVLDDPRVRELAQKYQRKPAEMLLAWANRKGITVVIFSGNHAQQNHAALDHEIPEELVVAIDRLAGYEEGATASVNQNDEALGRLYAACKDATAWYVLDLLAASPPVRKLLGDLVAYIVAAKGEKAGIGELEHMVLRILRFVTHIQTSIRLEKRDTEWTKELVNLFEAAAEKLGDAPSVEHFYAWTQTSHMKVGGAPDAQDAFETAASKHKQPVMSSVEQAKPAGPPQRISLEELGSSVFGIGEEGKAGPVPDPLVPNTRLLFSVDWRGTLKPGTVLSISKEDLEYALDAA